MNTSDNNLVFAGGFGNGKRSVARTAEILGKRLNVNDVWPTTYSSARKNPEKLKNKLREAKYAAGHSAAAIELVKPGVKTEYMFFNAPTPASRRHILFGGYLIAVHMHGNVLKNREPFLPTAKFDASYVAEVSSHFIANILPLVTGEIPRFDSKATFSAMVSEGAHVNNVQTIDDEYFQPIQQAPSLTTIRGVPTVTVAGGHSRFLVDTDLMLNEVFDILS